MQNQRQQRITDMRELRQRYKWDDNDVIEIKQAAAENPVWWDWWSELAKAHRDGYEQTEANYFQRLHVWQAGRV